MIFRVMKKVLWYGLPLGLLSAAALVIWKVEPPAKARPAVALACPQLRQGCPAQLNGRQISVGFEGAPAPLQPFQVWVRAPGAGQVQASFTMEGMEMGFNLYTLKPDAQGVFRAQVILPICVTGRSDWIMTLNLDGATLRMPFSAP